MTLFHLLKSIAQILAVVFSMLINCIQIVLVVHESPQKMGNYKFLLIFFCVISIVYAGIDFIVQPFLHSYGSSFSMIMDLRNSWLIEFRYVAFFFTASLAACFGMSIYAIAINFVYRFFAIERKRGTQYFAGYRLLVWMTIPIIFGIIWLSVGIFALDYDEQLVEYVSESINNSYGLDSRQITLTGCMYFDPPHENSGDWNWRWEDTIGAGILTAVMGIAFNIICFFGYKTHRKINSITENGESKFARRLQKQLYHALLAQTAIPLIFLFFPIGALFTAPLLHISLEKFSPLVTFFYSFYPCVDPIPTLYFVDEYRNGLLRVEIYLVEGEEHKFQTSSGESSTRVK